MKASEERYYTCPAGVKEFSLLNKLLPETFAL